ncbi:MAG: formyltransferase family protein [Chthoniobacter sp.]|nr:formyltransferase family protein [Chthoniobacter sp.]
MRIVFLGNNRVAVESLRWLKEQGAEIVGLVVHPEGKRRFAEELIEIAALPASRVCQAPQLRDPECLRQIGEWQPDLGLSVYFGYILKREFLDLFPRGVINLHPSLLPYNRGAHPNVWSIVERTPAGVSLHYVDQGIDTGDLVAQREIGVLPWDTGFTLYEKLEKGAVELLQENWPAISRGAASRLPQPVDAGTSHVTKDVARLDCIDLERSYQGRELIDLLRARTFPPYRNTYFQENGRRVFLRLELDPE